MKIVQKSKDGKLEKTQVQMPAQLQRERIKILDMSIHASKINQELTIFIMILNDTNQASQKSVHEFKYTNVRSIADIKGDNLKYTKLIDLEGQSMNKFAIGFDHNPYEYSDARPTRLYSEGFIK